jgi:hypothetical protein
MWELIVLGQIPGTQIQVSFGIWLAFIIGVIFCYGTLFGARSFKASKILVAMRINRAIRTAAYTQWLVTRQHIQA